MRASRLLSIQLLLQARGRLTAQMLANEFEISLRTVYRDMDALSAAGVPVYADRGRDGGYRLLDGYRTRLTGLTSDEADAVLLSGLPGPAADLGMGDAMANAQLKLLAALPSSLREGAQRVATRFHLDPVGWFRAAERTEFLPELAEAVWATRRIHVRYRSWSGTSDRALDPLGLVVKAGAWYLVAVAGGKPRTYRVASIQSLTVTEELFDRPDLFDLAAHWNSAAKEFETRLRQGEAVLRVTPQGLRRLSALVSTTEPPSDEPDETGWIRVTIPIESVERAAEELLKLGADVEALAPAELRKHMAREASALARLYARDIDLEASLTPY